MESYTQFASLYDDFMEDTPYEKWAEFIEKIWKLENLEPKLILDLGCGTGTMSRIFDKKVDVIAIDNSAEMLQIAKEKSENTNILYLEQDMTEFELFGTVDSIICLFDSINYILDEEELLKVFKLANNYLNPSGLFIFDINSSYKYEKILSDNTFAQSLEKTAYIWDNYYDKETKINEYSINFFMENEETKEYSRFEEFHYQKNYSISTIKKLMKKSGLELIHVFGDNTFEKPTKTEERIYFIGKEVTK